jgi:signal transduction histidine kinase/ActR/RegA family two-component response regulator
LRRSVPYSLFAAACALSWAVSTYVSSTAAATAEVQAQNDFLADAEQTRRQIQSGLNSYVEVVRTGAVLLAADNEINATEFRRFVVGLQLPKRYPGMEGIGFAQCVARAELGRFLRLMDLDGSRVRVWPESTRPVRCPVVFLEPVRGRSPEVIGFDLASNDAIAPLLEEARDSGQPVVSAILENVPFRSGGTGRIGLFLPVYRVGMATDAVPQRRRSLVGFVFSSFNPARLMQDIVHGTMPSVSFDVHDDAVSPPTSLVVASTTTPSGNPYSSSGLVQFANRQWRVVMTSNEARRAVPTPIISQSLLAGLGLAFLLFLVTRAQVRAWETAVRHEADLRASAEALKESEAEAHAANRAKDEFLATLSHELRTPLNVILGWINLLRAQRVSPERVPHALEIIERNARQQADLINDLLDVSRIVSGKLRLDLRPLAMAPLVAAVIESLRPSADAKGVALSMTTAASSNVVGDPDRLRQAVWNLVANAVKFTPSGGSVWVQLTSDERRVRIAVRDTGIGISPEFLPHVFERFRQADSSTTRAHAGVGLGLAIARHLIELHEGSIEADSDGTGRGATFAITLKAASAATGPAKTAAIRPAPPALAGVRVLVVDDDPNTLELLTEALGTSGAEVIAADSARQALTQLRERGADVIVSDIAMPGEDGLWFMRNVRTLPGQVSRTPAIALTALAHSDDRARALHAGFQRHLPKPLQLPELQEALAELVADRAAEPALEHRA